jgi:small subunit ribosomal protein S6
MSKYELVFILKPDLGDEATAALVTKYKDLIGANGTVDNVDEWGKRRLAYLINDQAEGYYVQINFTSAPDFPAELDRQLKINDAVLRCLIVATGK